MNVLSIECNYKQKECLFRLSVKGPPISLVCNFQVMMNRSHLFKSKLCYHQGVMTEMNKRCFILGCALTETVRIAFFVLLQDKNSLFHIF